jgi:RNA polymerase sigma factor (sigma-70 family)
MSNQATNEEALKPVDDSLVDVLVENHKRFRSFLSKRVGSDAVAEDLLQISLSKAIENPAKNLESTTIVAWFYQILRNTLTDYYRSRDAEGRKNDGYLQALTAEGRDHQPSMEEIEAAICECMNGLLPTLRENYREVIRRVDLGGEPISQVARDLGISENNLSVRLHRAREALKVSLERACGTCTEHGCLNCTCE